MRAAVRAAGLLGLTSEGDAVYGERTQQALAQEPGIRYAEPVSGRPRFVVPDDGYKRNPYAEGPSASAAIYDARAFATDVWRALWLAEAGESAVEGDGAQDSLLLGFTTAAGDVASLGADWYAKIACQAWNGLPIADPPHPHAPVRRDHPAPDLTAEAQTLVNCVAAWKRMRTSGNAPLERCIAGSYAFDFNVDGLAHYGLIPDLMQDLHNVGVGPTTLGALFNSAEQYIRAWERCQDATDPGRRIRELVTHVNVGTLVPH